MNVLTSVLDADGKLHPHVEFLALVELSRQIRKALSPNASGPDIAMAIKLLDPLASSGDCIDEEEYETGLQRLYNSCIDRILELMVFVPTSINAKIAEQIVSAKYPLD